MVDVQTISVIIAAASVVVGVVTFIMNSRKEAREKQIEFLLLRMQRNVESFEAWNEVMFVQDWKNLSDMLESLSTNPKANARFQYEGNYYNNLGLLLQEKVIDPDLLFKVQVPGTIFSTWKRFEPIVNGMRESMNDITFWNGFEYLASEAKNKSPEITVIRGVQVQTK